MKKLSITKNGKTEIIEVDDYAIIIDIGKNPAYYDYKIPPIEFVTHNNLPFPVANVIKYVLRYKGKNGLDDLEKAEAYIQYLKQEIKSTK